VGSTLAPAVVGAALALMAAAPAQALECPAIPLEQRLESADGAFVGHVTGERPAPGFPGQRIYRFAVEQKVKGPLADVVDVRAPRLVDSTDKPVIHGDSIGVLVELQGAAVTTRSCQLADPGGLLEVADQPRGTGIKVGVGVVILAVVVVYSVLRLRRKQPVAPPQ
jgi:hypothetical protein